MDPCANEAAICHLVGWVWVLLRHKIEPKRRSLTFDAVCEKLLRENTHTEFLDLRGGLPRQKQQQLEKRTLEIEAETWWAIDPRERYY